MRPSWNADAAIGRLGRMTERPETTYRMVAARSEPTNAEAP
jgi:hypothetical protein